MRYGLLETVRQYAADRLKEHDPEATARRHALWALALAETAEAELSGERQTQWFAALDAEHDNLRAALAYLDARSEKELELRLAVGERVVWDDLAVNEGIVHVCCQRRSIPDRRGPSLR